MCVCMCICVNELEEYGHEEHNDEHGHDGGRCEVNPMYI